MNQVSIWVIFISFFLRLHMTNSVEEEVKTSFISFLAKLSNNNAQLGVSLGWNSSLDPCTNHWRGVSCDQKNTSVTKLLAASIAALFFNRNNIGGGISAEFENCKQFTHLCLSGNQFSGSLPNSFAMLGNLKRLDISPNKFSGDLPELSRISSLTMFLAQDNQLSGQIPKFDFSNLDQFNVSNNFSGPIPDVGGRFSSSSFSGNPELCGKPLPKECPSLPLNGDNNSMSYVVLDFACLVLIIFKLCKLKKRKERVEGLEAVNKVAVVDDSVSKLAPTSTEYKSSVSRSENIGNLSESTLVLNSMVVLESSVLNGLKFEDLLIFKVMFGNGMILVVKRIKDWEISNNEFEQRMKLIDQVKHRNVLPALAFYCSKYEKLLVYEYQQNGSLFMLIHGNNQVGETFDWASRLGIAASIADALAFMHQELKEYGIVHGNLKFSNILMNKNMEPCISEYGLMAVDSDQYGSSLASVTGTSASRDFNWEIYGFGNNGVDLADWVHSVLQEEWTVEVFDKSLISEGASEERMVNLLQVAIKCVLLSPEGRPSLNQVSVIINTIKEEEERSEIYNF
ncbi:hypothetical protein ACB098_01G273300 [Castanea mollissima]